jgi:ribosomal protein S18 acetylase RimI-like enzyme
MIEIREYDPRRDRPSVKSLLLELFDLEKEVEPEWPSASEVIEPYFRYMLARCRKFEGTIFVAEDAGKVIGFISIWGKMKPNNPGDSQKERAFISDFVVHKPYRNRGIGPRLMAQAEEFARRKGVTNVRLYASGGNVRGRQYYKRQGYRELIVEFFKKLD